MTVNISAALHQVGISRLAHFTPSKNLVGIIRDDMIRSSKDLAENAQEYFSPTDRHRFDGHPDKLCCSFEFPNGYYLDAARKSPDYLNYPDWVCLLLDPVLVLREGVLFCPCNASTGGGTHLRSGGDALLACFAPTSPVNSWTRGVSHHKRAATDLQSEALVPAPISLSYLRAIVVPSEERAMTELNRLQLVGLQTSHLNWVIAPTFFSKTGLSVAIRYGQEIEEREWYHPYELEDRS